MTDSTPDDPVRIDFIEKTGLVTQAEGLPRIAGRVFGMLIFDGDTVSFGDLATKLQVSRASISTSIRILEERGLIKRVTRPGERQDYFQLAQDPYATMLAGIKKRHQSIRNDIAQTIAALPDGADAAPRLSAYAAFYASLDTALEAAITELDAARSPETEQVRAALKDRSDAS